MPLLAEEAQQCIALMFPKALPAASAGSSGGCGATGAASGMGGASSKSVRFAVGEAAVGEAQLDAGSAEVQGLVASLLAGVEGELMGLIEAVKPQRALLCLPMLGATLAWLWLVRWRTGRHRAVIWKSVVLPAGGVALCWLLLMTLWLPLLDYGRSNRPLAERLVRHVPPGRCIATPQAPLSLVAALEFHGQRRVDATPNAARGVCPVLMLVLPLRGPDMARGAALAESQRAAGWREVARERRPTERNEAVVVFLRGPA